MHGFELGSVHYDHYLVNIRLPFGKGYNEDFGQLKSMTVVVRFYFFTFFVLHHSQS